MFAAIALAICCMMIVLPALGGATMRPRWPLPIGATMSMTRGVRRVASEFSRRRRSCGYSGVSRLNSGRSRAASGDMPLTVSRRTSALNFWRAVLPWFSPSRGWRTAPVTASPRRSPAFFTWPSDT